MTKILKTINNRQYLVEDNEYFWTDKNKISYFIESVNGASGKFMYYEVKCTAEPIFDENFNKSLDLVESKTFMITDNHYDIHKLLEANNFSVNDPDLIKEAKLFEALSSDTLNESTNNIYSLYETTEKEVTDYLVAVMYEDESADPESNAAKFCEASMKYYEGIANFFAGKGGGSGLISTGLISIVSGLIGKFFPGPVGKTVQALVLGAGGIAKIASCMKVTKVSPEYLSIPATNKAARKKLLAKKVGLQIAQLGAATAVSLGISNWNAIASKLGSLFGKTANTASPVDAANANVASATAAIENAAKEPLPRLENGQVDIDTLKANPEKYLNDPQNFGHQISAIENGQKQMELAAAKATEEAAVAVAEPVAGVPAVPSNGMVGPAVTGNQIENTIAAQAAAKPGDLVTRQDGTTHVLTAQDITAAQEKLADPSKYPGWGATPAAPVSNGMVGPKPEAPVQSNLFNQTSNVDLSQPVNGGYTDIVPNAKEYKSGLTMSQRLSFNKEAAANAKNAAVASLQTPEIKQQIMNSPNLMNAASNDTNVSAIYQKYRSGAALSPNESWTLLNIANPSMTNKLAKDAQAALAAQKGTITADQLALNSRMIQNGGMFGTGPAVPNLNTQPFNPHPLDTITPQIR